MNRSNKDRKDRQGRDQKGLLEAARGNRMLRGNGGREGQEDKSK